METEISVRVDPYKVLDNMSKREHVDDAKIDAVLEALSKGDEKAGFSKEYRNCGNGYYYLLINDTYVIGCDID